MKKCKLNITSIKKSTPSFRNYSLISLKLDPSTSLIILYSAQLLQKLVWKKIKHKFVSEITKTYNEISFWVFRIFGKKIVDKFCRKKENQFVSKILKIYNEIKTFGIHRLFSLAIPIFSRVNQKYVRKLTEKWDLKKKIQKQKNGNNSKSINNKKECKWTKVS